MQVRVTDQRHNGGGARPNIPASALSEMDRIAMLQTAHQAADLSRAAILPHFRIPITVENKAQDASFDPVTVADRAAEQVIRDHIARHWPEHGLIGEEFGLTRETAHVQWIIDPIDGTRSFIIGSPLWGTLIGATCEAVPVLGLLDQPFTKERFYAGAQGAYLQTPQSPQPRPLATRACASLENAVLTTTHPDHIQETADLERFYSLKSRVQLSRYGGDCYAYGLLAAGFIDLVVETGLNTYDIAALIPIVEQAGGKITTWEGEPAIHGGRIIAAGDPALHEAAMNVLANPFG